MSRLRQPRKYSLRADVFPTERGVISSASRRKRWPLPASLASCHRVWPRRRDNGLNSKIYWQPPDDALRLYRGVASTTESESRRRQLRDSVILRDSCYGGRSPGMGRRVL